MFTYQVRERLFRLMTGQELTFPNSFEVTFFLQPLQPFGMSPGGGRTGVRASKAQIFFNANTGHHFLESSEPLKALEVLIEDPPNKVELQGNQFRISGHVESPKELENMLFSTFYALPILLNIEFGDPPVIERVEGKLGDISFRWELINWHMDCTLTTQEKQERKVGVSWKRFDIIAEKTNRRLAAALQYFHVYCRLCRAGHFPWEFMAEAIINLSKILEVLFPPSGATKSRDAARQGLASLGYSTEHIERYFIPAMLLRSQIDGAHASMAVLKMSQLRILHSYTEIAEKHFRELFGKIFTELEAGRHQISPYDFSDNSDIVKTIEKLAQFLAPAEKKADA